MNVIFNSMLVCLFVLLFLTMRPLAFLVAIFGFPATLPRSKNGAYGRVDDIEPFNNNNIIQHFNSNQRTKSTSKARKKADRSLSSRREGVAYVIDYVSTLVRLPLHWFRIIPVLWTRMLRATPRTYRLAGRRWKRRLQKPCLTHSGRFLQRGRRKRHYGHVKSKLERKERRQRLKLRLHRA